MTAYLGTLGPFLQWFISAVALTTVFVLIYTRLTPHPEFKLMLEGNVATAIAFGGVVLGYVIPLASVMLHGVNIVDFAIWGFVAMLVQLGVYLALRVLFKDYSRHLAEGHVAVAVFGACVSLATGILNAAAQSS